MKRPYLSFSLALWLIGMSVHVEAELDVKQKLAIQYLNEQELEKSIKTFLEALEEATVLSPPISTLDEDRVYVEALDMYKQPQSNLRENAHAILEKFGPYLCQHPESFQLGFILASAYANLGLYGEFYQTFYPSYQRYPTHFLAYKTKAILNLKLFERKPVGEEKEFQRQQLLANLAKAREMDLTDLTVYKMLYTFSSEEDKAAVLEDNLNKILSSNMIIPRRDLIDFIDQMVRWKQMDNAERLLRNAREWYPNSRIIETAQEFLNQKTQK